MEPSLQYTLLTFDYIIKFSTVSEIRGLKEVVSLVLLHLIWPNNLRGFTVLPKPSNKELPALSFCLNEVTIPTPCNLQPYSYQNKINNNKSPYSSLYTLSRCSPPQPHYCSHPVSSPFCLQNVPVAVDSELYPAQPVRQFTPSPSLVWRTESAFTGLFLTLPFTLALKSPLQNQSWPCYSSD